MAVLREGRTYPTDLTDAQWLLLKPLLPAREASPGSRPPASSELASTHRRALVPGAHGLLVAITAQGVPLLGYHALLLR